ncbi:MAG: hypothetical protein AABW57_02010 [Nanoarchaeota archaeon]|mgnify:FL=1
MKNLVIKLNELKINNYNRNDDSFILHIVIDVNGEKDFLKKGYKIERFEDMTRDLINFVRESVKDKNKSSLTSDLIESIVIVRFADDLEELEEKLIKFFRKFSDLVKGFKNRGYSENYLMMYKTVDGFSQRF